MQCGCGVAAMLRTLQADLRWISYGCYGEGVSRTKRKSNKVMFCAVMAVPLGLALLSIATTTLDCRGTEGKTEGCQLRKTFRAAHTSGLHSVATGRDRAARLVARLVPYGKGRIHWPHG